MKTENDVICGLLREFDLWAEYEKQKMIDIMVKDESVTACDLAAQKARYYAIGKARAIVLDYAKSVLGIEVEE